MVLSEMFAALVDLVAPTDEYRGRRPASLAAGYGVEDCQRLVVGGGIF